MIDLTVIAAGLFAMSISMVIYGLTLPRLFDPYFCWTLGIASAGGSLILLVLHLPWP